MASGDIIASIQPRDLIPGSGPEGWIQQGFPAGSLRGVLLRDLDTQPFFAEVNIPSNGSPLGTGLTFVLSIAEDTASGNAALPGNADATFKAIRLGVQCKRIVSGTDDQVVGDGSNTGVETFTTVTLPSTPGVTVSGSIAIAKSAMGNPVAGDRLEVQIRRVGSDPADTHRYAIVLLGVKVTDT